MRLRSAFLLLCLIGIALLGLGVWAFADTSVRAARLNEMQKLSSAVSSDGFRLALVTSDFLLHREVRSGRQWRELYARLRADLSEHQSALDPYRREVRNIEDHLADLESLFGQIQLRSADAGTPADDDQLYALLTSQAAIRITELQSAIDEFEIVVGESVDQGLGASSGSFYRNLLGLFLLYGLFATSVWMFFYSRMLKPLSALEAGVRRINAGDTDFRPARKADDELGSVIDAVNALLDSQQAAERSLKRSAAELRRANDDLESFAYAASHDLKAPLRGIEHLAIWIEEDLKGTADAEVQENLSLLKSRVRRMASLIEALLQFSRIGRREYPAEPVDIGKMIGDIVELLSLPEGFEVTVAKQMPPLVTQKPPLELIFRNLIGNAVKHHDRPSGRITVEWRDLGDDIEFSVSDDGPGIDPEFQEKIFGMFQTLKPRDEVEGSGMGLALVKRAVEHHGGTIRLDSRRGVRGARFFFTWRKGALG